MGKLEGKTAVITGGSSRFELAPAKRFVEKSSSIIRLRRLRQANFAGPLPCRDRGRAVSAPSHEDPFNHLAL